MKNILINNDHKALANIGTLTHATIDSYLDQSVKVAASPTFAGLTVDTDTLYVDAANNRVGIGTTTPIAELTLLDSSASDAGVQHFTIGKEMAYHLAMGYANGGSTVGFLANNWTDAAARLDFRLGGLTNTSTKMTILGSGNVGIGTTGPGAQLELSSTYVSGDTDALRITRASSIINKAEIHGRGANGTIASPTITTTNDELLSLSGYGYDTTGSSTYKFGAAIDINRDANVGDANRIPGYIRFRTSQTNDSTIYERMRITSTGNVGIGTTGPATYLHIKGQNVVSRGQLTLEATDHIQLTMYKDATIQLGYLYYYVGGNQFTIQNHNNGSYGDLLLNPNGGNVGIGTTGPNAKLDVNGTIRTNDNTIYLSTGTDTNHGIGLGSFASLSQDGPAIFGYSGGVLGSTNGTKASLIWRSSGDVGLGGTITDTAFTGASMVVKASGNVGIGTTGPTALLHLKAGTATANTAPLKFTSGTNLTTPEAGAMEYDGTQLYFSPSTTRNILAQVSGSTAFTTGSIPFATTNGYLTQNNSYLFWDNTNKRLGIGTTTPKHEIQFSDQGCFDSIPGAYEVTLRQGEYFASPNDKWLVAGKYANAINLSSTGLIRFYTTPDLGSAVDASVTNWACRMQLEKNGALTFQNSGYIQLAVGTPQLYMAGSDANWTYCKYNSPSGANMVTAAAVVQGVGQVDNEGWMIKGHSGLAAFEVSGTGNVLTAGNINVASGKVYKVNSVQVVGARVVDARADDTVSDTYGATEAGVLDAIRDACISHGLIAAA